MSDEEKINNLEHGESVCLNMFEEGGAEVYRVYNVFVLFEIPSYGGEPQYFGTYYKQSIPAMIEKYMSWT